MDLAERIRAHELTAGERRVADLVLGDPSRLAFGSVATVAADAGVGNSTVMRFASRIGFAGFRELQDAARVEMDGRLRQATHRIRQHPTGDPIARARDVELANLQETFARIDPTVATDAAAALASAGHVAVLAGDAAGRRSDDEITVFDSTGLAIHDLAIALAALEQAEDLDLPTMDV